ncbi:MAG: hypothetical protein UY70_C0012G0007 [Candidatus Kaiserbacteria bacterium GW2011_GWB1_52_6]|uniref:Uncharacterized protein n=2 Tax=Candidatus Kaiseribacteriota TaxID=1752734 RepID=A0A0G1X9K7_9BACT|nr:MAG: hypothetical protein UY67_C0010G0019 [Candidatus Kaiserbacteria bacterium GW2011_GWA2_52_12]KKW27535.1 MAG: hypothetical protein UY70_C0012G0007 [Candidatus Kaiserbacteria bacterium GW2011_GWB1_52_6]
MVITDRDIQKLKEVFPTKDDVRSIVKMEVRTIVREELEELHTKVDLIDGKVDQVEETLEEHTRDLNTIKNDVKTNLEKRMKLEVRVNQLEAKI